MQNAKIILMGDKEVGKTSIINTFVTCKSSLQAKPTNMVEDHIKMVDVNENGVTTRLKLHIWDAAGDNNVHNLAHLFVKDVQVGIFVYGINSLQSFKNLDAWQEHLEKENQDYIVFLVGNKMDLEEQRAVSYAQGASKKRITDKCVYFTETSAYSNVESITNLFDEIGKAIVRKGCYQKNRGSIRLSK